MSIESNSNEIPSNSDPWTEKREGEEITGEIEENEDCKKLECGHIFHSACIDNWLKRTLECPMCRNIIT